MTVGMTLDLQSLFLEIPATHSYSWADPILRHINLKISAIAMLRELFETKPSLSTKKYARITWTNSGFSTLNKQPPPGRLKKDHQWIFQAVAKHLWYNVPLAWQSRYNSGGGDSRAADWTIISIKHITGKMNDPKRIAAGLGSHFWFISYVYFFAPIVY